MDIGVILGPAVVALLCLPVAYALHAPAWSAGLLAALFVVLWNPYESLIFTAPIAVLVCVCAEKWLFAGVLRVQIFAVALMVLSLLSLPSVWPLTVGFALGAFYDRSLKHSLLLYRATALTLMVLVVAMHPAFWAPVEGSRSTLVDYLAPAMAMIWFAIATQIGSGVLKRARAASRDRLFIVAEQEIAGLMGRITARESLPA